MKSLKVIAIAAVATLTVGSIFAFTSKNEVKSNKAFAVRYFEYTSADQTPTAIHNPENYDELPGEPSAVAGTSDLAWIAVDVTNVYPNTDPNFPNLPKVDAASSGTTIYARVDLAEGDYSSPFEHIERK